MEKDYKKLRGIIDTLEVISTFPILGLPFGVTAMILNIYLERKENNE